MNGLSDLGKRIREVRGGMTQVQFAKLVGINVNTLRGYETGSRMPGADITARIAAACHISIEWLITGQTSDGGKMAEIQTPRVVVGQANTILPRPPEWMVPLMGFAECGLKGWYNIGLIAARIAAPADYPYAPGLVAVVAFGRSMEPVGINAGNVLYCDPEREPEPKDAVYITRKDGKASVKLFLSRDDENVIVQGWVFPLKGNGPPRSYTDKLLVSELTALAPVVQIKKKG